MGIKFNDPQCDKGTPGLLKVDTTKTKMISLSSKMYCTSDVTEEENYIFT